MKKKLIIVFFLSIYSICFGQNELNFKKKHIIKREYKIAEYAKVAKDTIKMIYEKQAEYLLKMYTPKELQEYKTNNYICHKYKLEDLDLYSIPTFKLKKEAFIIYNLNKNIEDFIDFKPDYACQSIYIYKQDTLLRNIEIPNFIYESLKKHDAGENFSQYNMKKYEKIMESFVFSTNYTKAFRDCYLNRELSRYNMRINKKSGNFYFMIYGLTSELFEIDKFTGIVYMNDIGYLSRSPHERLPANEYILRYIGADVIKQLARGYFDGEEQPIASTYYKKSDAKYIPNKKKVYLDFKRIE
jgi:hypothetical protein